jgi:hypothetical protein
MYKDYHDLACHRNEAFDVDVVVVGMVYCGIGWI